jgi:hypothetical protein
MNQTWESNDASSARRVECPATREPAVRKVILAALLIGFGLWCYLDRGKYPKPEDWSLKNINLIGGYVINNWAPMVLLPLGVLILIWMAVGLRKKLLADGAGIGYAGGRKIAWGEVDKLDASRLQSKGLVVLHAGGRRMVLDSYYLANFRDLMALVERQVPAEKQVLA